MTDKIEVNKNVELILAHRLPHLNVVYISENYDEYMHFISDVCTRIFNCDELTNSEKIAFNSLPLTRDEYLVIKEWINNIVESFQDTILPIDYL